jgi:HSP20 family protein
MAEGGIHMSMVRWEPLAELDAMRRTMDRLFEQLNSPRLFGGLPALEGGLGFMPNIEVSTLKDEVVLTAELPGIEPDEVNIEITEDAVHLMGECKRAREVSEDAYWRSERRYGRFDRVVALPNPIKQEAAKAVFSHGLLTIRAPLAEPLKQPQMRRLKVEASGR